MHYLDGGLVNSIPVERALDLGARTVYVLQVGRIDQPLAPRAGRGRSGWWRSRSPGGTGSTRTSSGSRGRGGARAALRLGAVAVDDDELPRRRQVAARIEAASVATRGYLAGLGSEATR